MSLHLISHLLCPYVQRAAIALTEKQAPFRRTYVDLADKPDWFLEVSPLGKTPVLLAGDRAIFESAVILEYLEDTQPRPLHPSDALERARHRGFVEVASAILDGIAGFYNAPDAAALAAKAEVLAQRFARVEAALGDGPWFGGTRFGLVDAAFGPVFRYFDSFDRIGDFGILDRKPKLAAWRAALARRPSVRAAVTPDYPALLEAFIARRGSALSALQAEALAA